MPQGHPASRQNGVCRGSLWKQHCSSITSTKDDALLKNEREKRHEYCILAGNTLSSYPDAQSYRRGDYPTSEIRIVGASAWNPTTTGARGLKKISPLHANNPFSFSPTRNGLASSPTGGRAGVTSVSAHGTTGGGSSGGGSSRSITSTGSGPAGAGDGGGTVTTTNTGPTATVSAYDTSPTFRIVTYAGTHVYCIAPTCTDRDVWLSALHSGLEACYATNDTSTSVSGTKMVEQEIVGAGGGHRSRSCTGKGHVCTKCGGLCEDTDSRFAPSSASASSVSRLRETNDSMSLHVVSHNDNDDSSTGSSSSSSTTPSDCSSSATSTDYDSDPWVPPDHDHRKSKNRVNSINFPSKQVRVQPYKRQTSLDHMETMKAPLPPRLGRTGTTTTMQSTATTTSKYCRSCGIHKYHPRVPSPESLKLYFQACTLPQYKYETRNAVEWICQNCYIGQGLLWEMRTWNGLYSSFFHERAAMRAARDAARLAVRRGVERAEAEAKEKELRDLSPGDGAKVSPPENSKSKIIAGTNAKDKRSGSGTRGCGASRSSLESSWENIPELRHYQKSRQQQQQQQHHDGSKGSSSLNSISTSNSWHQVSPSDLGTSSLLQLLQTPGFATLRRRSRALELECLKLESGLCSGAVEFLDVVESLCGPKEDYYHPLEGDSSKMEMKKEAFKVAGDMSAAMKLLHDHALGYNVRDAPSSVIMDTATLLRGGFSSTYTTQGNSIYMLKCLLELFLDLCEEGELSAVAFFWPQLRHLHLRMLPPIDADALMRVELVEDFLLTVSARFSVHLALELVWGLIADLEEAFQGMNLWPSSTDAEGESMIGGNISDDVSGANAGEKCRMRRFAVLRFVCELESIMFDFDGGWGGGSVALRGILSPSEHQATLIRENISTLQGHRLNTPHYLTRSVRRDLLLREKRQQQPHVTPAQQQQKEICSRCQNRQLATSATTPTRPSRSSIAMPSKDVLQRNAYYFSSQMLFVRRLGDIAERLRFLPVTDRELALESELELLNLMLKTDRKRGRIAGGDPLSRGETFDTTVGGVSGAGAFSGTSDESGGGRGYRDEEWGLSPVVNVPMKEGHVFRSKARTPVLLLFEVIREGGSDSNDQDDANGNGIRDTVTSSSSRVSSEVAGIATAPGMLKANGDDAMKGNEGKSSSPSHQDQSNSSTEMEDSAVYHSKLSSVGTRDDTVSIGGKNDSEEAKGNTTEEKSDASLSPTRKPGRIEVVSSENSATVSDVATSADAGKVVAPGIQRPPPCQRSLSAGATSGGGGAPLTPNHHKSIILKRLDSPLSGSPASPTRSSKKGSTSEKSSSELPLSPLDFSGNNHGHGEGQGHPTRQRIRSIDQETEELVASVMEQKLSIHESSHRLRLPKLEELGLADEEQEQEQEERLSGHAMTTRNASSSAVAATTEQQGCHGVVAASSSLASTPPPATSPPITPKAKSESPPKSPTKSPSASFPGPPKDFSRCGNGQLMDDEDVSKSPTLPTSSEIKKPLRFSPTGYRGCGTQMLPSSSATVVPSAASSRKMSALAGNAPAPGTAVISSGGQGVKSSKRYLSSLATPIGAQHPPPLAMFGEGRREVLTTILAKGMTGNVIAKSTSAAAKRTVQVMDRKRAVELIQTSSHGEAAGGGEHGTIVGTVAPAIADTNDSSDSRGVRPTSATSSRNGSVCDDDGEEGGKKGYFEVNFPDSDDDDHTSVTILSDAASSSAVTLPNTGEGAGPSSANITGQNADGPRCTPEEEDEAMESLRLVLIQNRVAQGNLSPEHAARALGPDGALTLQQQDVISSIHQDAGEIDKRLAGCGPLTHGLLSALQLWKTGVISNAELLELAHKDQLFLRLHLPGAENLNKLMDDSAFWVRFAFGERWAEKKARISARSVHGGQKGWDLVSVIVKSNDDLRQEAFVMQLIELCQEAFELAGLELWLHPYRIVATSSSTGIIETLKNALSFDSLKKRPGYQDMGGLRGHFLRMTEFAANPKEAFRAAQHNFVRSLAAYSLISHLFLFKDRHNGNLLLDTAGHVIHIDFGFVFGIAPGGSFSLESNTPFKLTEEMVDVMGGVQSALFSEFVTLFCCGFLALQAHVDTFLTLVEITCKDSAFPCFAGKESSEVVEKLRERFRPNLDKTAAITFALDLIKQSLTSYGTKQYDFFQYLSQGIAT